MAELFEHDGTEVEEIAAVFGAGESGVRRVLQRYRERGARLPLPHNAGRRPLMDGPLAERVRTLVAARPDATRQEVKDTLGPAVSVQTVGEWLTRLGLTRKKSLHAAGRSGTKNSSRSCRTNSCSSTSPGHERA